MTTEQGVASDQAEKVTMPLPKLNVNIEGDESAVSDIVLPDTFYNLVRDGELETPLDIDSQHLTPGDAALSLLSWFQQLAQYGCNITFGDPQYPFTDVELINIEVDGGTQTTLTFHIHGTKMKQFDGDETRIREEYRLSMVAIVGTTHVSIRQTHSEYRNPMLALRILAKMVKANVEQVGVA